jgi:hypothetical protein
MIAMFDQKIRANHREWDAISVRKSSRLKLRLLVASANWSPAIVCFRDSCSRASPTVEGRFDAFRGVGTLWGCGIASMLRMTKVEFRKSCPTSPIVALTQRKKPVWVIRRAGADQRFNSFRLAITSSNLRPVILAIFSSANRPTMPNSHCPHWQTSFDRPWRGIPSRVRFVRTAVFEPASFVAISLSLTVPSKAMMAGVQCGLRCIQANVTRRGLDAKKMPAANSDAANLEFWPGGRPCARRLIIARRD